MIYKLDSEQLFQNRNMILPLSVADACVDARTLDQVRVMLRLYQKPLNSPVSDEILAAELNMSVDAVSDALDYWVGKGLVREWKGGAKTASTLPARDAVQTKNATNSALEKVENPAADLPVQASASESGLSASNGALAAGELGDDDTAEEKIVPVDTPTAKDAAKIKNRTASKRGTGENVQEEKKKIVEIISVNPPTQAQLVRRCKESSELRELMMVTEEKLGSTLSFTMQSTLLMLYDDYGLPVEVIATAVEYSSKCKKLNTRYLATLGKNWCENEIDTVDKAMEYIEEIQSIDRYWAQFKSLTGVTNPSPTKKQKDFLLSWINTLKFSMEMIALAYEEMAEHTGKFNFGYMDKVLTGWHKNGITTPAGVEYAKKERFEQSQKKNADKKAAASADESSDASYDLDAYTKKAFANPLDILKRGE